MRKLIFLVSVIMSFVVSCAYEGSKGRIDIINPVTNLYNQGMDYYRMRNYDLAIRNFKDIVEYYPDNPLADKALIMLANCYEEMGNYSEALSYYKLYLIRYPNGKNVDFVKEKVIKLQKMLEM